MTLPTEPTEAESTPLADLMHTVADARRKSLALRAELHLRQTEFDAAHADLIAAVKSSGEVVALAENVAEAALVGHYRRTGKLSPTPGGSVKLYVVLSYLPGAALGWAKEKQMALIPEQLDVKAFEKLAKVTPLPFVTITKEPKAAIASDLDKALGLAP